MRVLLDNNVSHPFSQLLHGHDVTHVQQLGWEDLKTAFYWQRQKSQVTRC